MALLPIAMASVQSAHAQPLDPSPLVARPAQAQGPDPDRVCPRLARTPARTTLCSHGGDPVEQFGGRSDLTTPPPSASAPALSALCSDGGVSGQRVEVLYGVPRDRTNRYNDMLTTMRNVVAQVDSNLDASDASTTQHYRFLCEERHGRDHLKCDTAADRFRQQLHL